MTMSQMLKEADKKRKLRREKRNCKRATVMVKSGAMTFLVIAATLVTASFLMSPTIEKIFGWQFVFIFVFILYIFVVVDKLASTETKLQETTANMNCSLEELYRQDYRCWNITIQTVDQEVAVYSCSLQLVRSMISMLQASVSTGSGLGGGLQAFHSASHPLLWRCQG